MFLCKIDCFDLFLVDECKQRWRSLRDRYVREKRKIVLASGSAAMEPDIWPYFNQLQFLNQSIKPRQQSSNYVEEHLEELDMIIEEQSPHSDEPKTAKKRKGSDHDTTSIFSNLSKIVSKRLDMDKPTDNEIFMKAQAQKMDKLPIIVQLELQEKIISLINGEVIKNLNK